MKRIYKYQLGYDGEVIVIKEKVERILHVGAQNGVPMLWALVDIEQVGRTEVVAWGTGWDIADDLAGYDYVGTAQDERGYVWHYFSLTVA